MLAEAVSFSLLLFYSSQILSVQDLVQLTGELVAGGDRGSQHSSSWCVRRRCHCHPDSL